MTSNRQPSIRIVRSDFQLPGGCRGILVFDLDRHNFFHDQILTNYVRTDPRPHVQRTHVIYINDNKGARKQRFAFPLPSPIRLIDFSPTRESICGRNSQ